MRFLSGKILMGRYRFRSAEDIFEEMKLRYEQGFREFFFNDLTMNGNLNQLEKLCDLIINSKMKGEIELNGQFRCNKNLNTGHAEKLQKAGLDYILFGVESGSNKVLKLMEKGYKKETVRENLRDFKKSGIKTGVNIIVGFPGESDETIRESIRFLKENEKYIDSLGGIYTVEVIGGSKLERNSEKYGIESPDNFNNETCKDFWKSEKFSNNYEKRFDWFFIVLKNIEEMDIDYDVNDLYYTFKNTVEYYKLKGNYEKLRQKSTELIEYLVKNWINIKKKSKN